MAGSAEEVFQPTTFGNYFLTRRLAVGGMAEVFAAKLYGADGFEKDIVIKQILPQYARDPEFVQSFVAEAKIVVTLNHANIASIYELGRVDGTYFIAMELVDGLDVFTLIDGAKRLNTPIDPGLSLLIVEDVAKGLDYAHRKLGPDQKPLGLVHRDLSPRNVLVSREGEVKILDFGIAKTRSEAAAMPKTRAGVVKGTTGYMSPEQATGGEVDSRTDVYQAGLMLWELLTGESLFWRPDDNETRELMRRHRVPRPSEINPAVPEELDRIVLAALARDPTKRVQTATELGAAISRLRIARYPDATPRDLGELVARVATVDELEAEQRALDLPTTQELKTANVRVETFAQSPLATEAVALAPPPPPPASNTRPISLVPKMISGGQVTAIQPPLNPSRPFLAGSVIIAAAAVIVWGVGALAERNDDPVPKIDPPAVKIAEPQPEPPLIEITATASPAVVEVKKDPEPKTKKRDPEPKKDAIAAVSFGTKSCSSRVSVDGVVLARSTPSYDHKISAGEHTITVEGTSCPLIERPGSLKPSIPTVVKKVNVAAGARLKLIADFERELLIVREE